MLMQRRMGEKYQSACLEIHADWWVCVEVCCRPVLWQTDKEVAIYDSLSFLFSSSPIKVILSSLPGLLLQKSVSTEI